MKPSFWRSRVRQALLGLLLATPALQARSGVWEGLQQLVDPEARSNRGQSLQTVIYTPPGWPQALAGDLYLPAERSPPVASLPVVLLLHGGAWQQGDKAEMRGVGQVLADRGYAAFAINYRLAPGARYPAQLQDMQQALGWLRRAADGLRLDLDRIAAWGYAAGGQLAALLAVQPPSALPPLRVVVAGGAPMDLRATAATDAAAVRALLGGDPGEFPALYVEASPLARVRPGLPAFFLFHGTADQQVHPLQSQVFADALALAGVPVELIWLEGLDQAGAGAAPQIRPAALEFLDHHIREAPPEGEALPLPPREAGHGPVTVLARPQRPAVAAGG